jgi:hypothetical protein
LKDKQHSPLVLGIQFVLQLGQSHDAMSECFFRSRFVRLLGEFERVVRIHVLETKILAFGDSEWFG